MKLTAHQIIDETVTFYHNNPRSVSKGQCLYNGDNGEKCAYSRCCTPDSWFTEGKSASYQNNAALLPQYEGYSSSFWCAIQRLHDSDLYWDGNGLTEDGVKQVEYLKSHY